MAIPHAVIKHNLAEIRNRIHDAALRVGRDPSEVLLVAVTKTVGLEEIQSLHDLGVRHFGENRLQSARNKIEQFAGDATWHMVGNVQRRKCPEIVRLFHRIDAVDRLAVAEAFERRCEESAREHPLPVLAEVNVSGEPSKHGFAPEALAGAIDKIRDMKHLQLEGLLTMAPLVEDPEATRPFFARLRNLAEELGLGILSMGMSNDFEIAIEEGATQVRIGSALFKHQPDKD